MHERLRKSLATRTAARRQDEIQAKPSADIRRAERIIVALLDR